jgi:hypothetical protein
MMMIMKRGRVMIVLVNDHHHVLTEIMVKDVNVIGVVHEIHVEDHQVHVMDGQVLAGDNEVLHDHIIVLYHDHPNVLVHMVVVMMG